MDYLGWTNWATRNVNVWIDSQESLRREKVRFLRTTPSITAAKVKAFCLERYPRGTPDMRSSVEMDEVDWVHLAESWAAEANEYRQSET